VREKSIKIGYDNKGVYIEIRGEGTVRQSNSLKKLLFDMIDQLKTLSQVDFYMDLKDCQYIDSTFIGLFLILDKKITETMQKHLVILNSTGYVLDVIRQMGLENILSLENNGPSFPENMQKLEVESINKIELAMLMYMAHSELANLNDDNKSKFEAAIMMLKKEIENEGIDINNIQL